MAGPSVPGVERHGWGSNCTVRGDGVLPPGVDRRRRLPPAAVYSNNLGVLTCGTDTAEITCLARSSIPSLLSSDYLPAMEAVAEALGIHGKAGESFPCWEYVEDSPIRKVCEETYFQLNGRFP